MSRTWSVFMRYFFKGERLVRNESASRMVTRAAAKGRAQDTSTFATRRYRYFQAKSSIDGSRPDTTSHTMQVLLGGGGRPVALRYFVVSISRMDGKKVSFPYVLYVDCCVLPVSRTWRLWVHRCRRVGGGVFRARGRVPRVRILLQYFLLVRDCLRMVQPIRKEPFVRSLFDSWF